MTVQPTPTWDLLPTCGLRAPACTLCCSVLRTQNSIWNRSSSNVPKALLSCSSLCSSRFGLSWKPEVFRTFLSQDDIWKVTVNAFCETTWAVLYVTALSCCYYICLIFLTCFRSQSFRYLMQSNKGERGQNPLTSLHHRRCSSLISMVIMQFCVLLKLHLPLSYKGGDAKGEANVITNLSAIQQP